MESDEQRLVIRIRELREALELLGIRERGGSALPRERAKLAAKLAHVEKRLFNLRQSSFWHG